MTKSLVEILTRDLPQFDIDKSVMDEKASIYVHLDWHIGHYVKILMDEVFGEDLFRNEIIWYYADYIQGNATTGFAKKHDGTKCKRSSYF